MIDSPLLKSTLGFIDGRWCESESRDTFAVRNPADNTLLAEVPNMNGSDAERAIVSASKRQRITEPQNVRAGWLRAIGDSILANRDELGRIITLEHGKPIGEGIAEAEYAASFFHFYSNAITHLNQRNLPQHPKNHRWSVHFRPAGVVGLITPWNFPIAMLAKKLSASLAAGCCSVIKPSQKTPLATIALFHLLESLEIPAGVANLVLGSPAEISQVLCSHSVVRVISFTGSTEVGKHLMREAAPHLKRLSLELGGNAPFIIFSDADLHAAATHLVQNKFRASGQTCVCANRIYVQAPIAEAFSDILIGQVKKLRVGNGMEEGVDIGPLIDKNAFIKVLDHVDDAINNGARLIFGDRPQQVPSQNDGAFFPPLILSDVTDRMKCVNEETFGPLISISQFTTETDVIAAANQTQYGLAAYVFSSDKGLADRVASKLQFGHVGINTGTGPTAEAPFGGFKQSGFGREGGIEGLHDFVEPQTITTPN